MIYLTLHERVEKVGDLPLIGPYLETQETKDGIIDEVDNYDRLQYGFCVFCKPSDSEDSCQAQFEEFGQTGENTNFWRFFNTFSNLDGFSTVEDYAH